MADTPWGVLGRQAGRHTPALGKQIRVATTDRRLTASPAPAAHVLPRGLRLGLLGMAALLAVLLSVAAQVGAQPAAPLAASQA